MLRTCYTALDTHPPPRANVTFFLNLEIDEQKKKRKKKEEKTALNAEFAAQTGL
jgi:hypothetical protein